MLSLKAACFYYLRYNRPEAFEQHKWTRSFGHFPRQVRCPIQQLLALTTQIIAAQAFSPSQTGENMKFMSPGTVSMQLSYGVYGVYLNEFSGCNGENGVTKSDMLYRLQFQD